MSDVARVYAKALYETAIAAQNGHRQDVEEIEKQLAELSALVSASHELSTVFSAPIVTPKERAAVVQAIAAKAGLGELLTRFLTILGNKGRLGILTEIYEAFSAARVQAEGGMIGQLVVIDPTESVSAQDIETLAKAFGRKLGKKVHFRVSSEPELLAGMKVTVGGVTYDSSLRSQLQRLHDQLILSHPT